MHVPTLHIFREGQEDGEYGSEGDRVISEQPRESSQLEPLTVRISLPREDDDDEDYDDEDAEQAHMMGFEVEEDEEEEREHVRTARGRATPQVQRAQSELVNDRRAAPPNISMVQRSMSESRG